MNSSKGREVVRGDGVAESVRRGVIAATEVITLDVFRKAEDNKKRWLST
jgi:hypothetical protein